MGTGLSMDFFVQDRERRSGAEMQYDQWEDSHAPFFEIPLIRHCRKYLLKEINL